MDEEQLVAHARAVAGPPPAGSRGIGDDCCSWVPGGETCLSTDTVVEGRHFTADHQARAVGGKAAAAALSDLAAMGARPRGAVLALTCPGHWDGAAVVDGVAAELARYGCPLLGGDTTGGRDLVVTVTVWGEPAEGGRLLGRDGGRPGDLLVVTGRLGGSLRSGRHLRPQPRFAEGAWLAGLDHVHALMDLSDGLAADAPRLAQASGCGCILLPGSVPVHADVDPYGDVLTAAMEDGEDYELLAAIEPGAWPRLQLAWPFEGEVTVVGWLVEQPGCQIEGPDGRLRPSPFRGFHHRE